MADKAMYEVQMQFGFKDGQSFIDKQTVKMFTGDFPAAAPLNNVSPVRVRFDGLTFRQLDPDFLLDKVKVDLKSGTRTYNSDWVNAESGTIPPPVVWIVKASDPVTATVQFKYKDVERDKRTLTHHWRFNGIDFNRPRKIEFPKLDAAKQKKLGEDTTKALDAAKKIADEDDRAIAYAQAITDAMQLPADVANADDGALAPLGLDVTLEDARLADVMHKVSANDSTDDKDAFVEFVRLLVRDKKRIGKLDLRGYANRVLWYKYMPDDYRDE